MNKSVPHRAHPFVHTRVFWDLMILLLCIVCIAMVYARVLSGTAFIAYCMVMYGSFVAPKRIKVNTKSIHISGMPSMTVAVVADFHVGPYKKERFVRQVVRRINREQPDLILIPGDFLFDDKSDVTMLAPLAELHAPLGVFATMGNHDSGDHTFGKKRYRTMDRTEDVETFLDACGITVLRNASDILEKDGRTFAVTGIDDQWMDSSDLTRAFADIPRETPTILLAHSPDVTLDAHHARADLIVTGHTHGGQIRLPLIGALGPIPSTLGRKRDRGIFRLESGTLLAVTSGAGESLVRSRLFCRPEVLMLNINAQS